MRRSSLWLITLVLFSQSAQAEGFKCTLNRDTKVGANGAYEAEDHASVGLD